MSLLMQSAFADLFLLAQIPSIGFAITAIVFCCLAAAALLALWLTVRYIPNNAIGVVEKLWSPEGSVSDGHIIALSGEAGFQAEVLRGGIHFRYWRWQYSVHRCSLVTISQGKIGYVYARDGEPLQPSQTLGRDVPCNSFQDARRFLSAHENDESQTVIGQRGRQRAILREGVYAINPALFVVITEERVYGLSAVQTPKEIETIETYRRELAMIGGFSPIMVGAKMDVDERDETDMVTQVDSIGVVTVHDGPSLPPDEIIAPIVGGDASSALFHNNFQMLKSF